MYRPFKLSETTSGAAARWTVACALVLASLLCLSTVSAASVVTLFEDDFEGTFPGPWQLSNVNETRTNVNWGLNTYRAFGGSSHSVFCAREGSFENGNTYFDSLVNYMDFNLLNLGIDLDTYHDVTLTFKAWVRTEESFDFFRVSLLEVNETQLWTTALVLTGDLSASGWQEYTVHFSDVADTTVTRFGFDFISDTTVVPAGDAGVWIDDVVLTATTDAGEVDLAIENLTLGPVILQDTTVFDSVNLDIVNYGPLDLVGEDVLLTFYLSQNSAFGDSDDILIGDGAGAISIEAGFPFNVDLTPQGLINMTRLWPEDLAEGSYFVFAEISLVSDTLTDPNPGNNHDRIGTAFTYAVTNEYSVRIRTEPNNVAFSIDGNEHLAPYTFSVPEGTSFNLSIEELIDATPGSRARFESWSDDGSRTHIVMPNSDTIITAILVREHLLTMAANPDAGGTVLPSSGNWYPEGGEFAISATARTGYRFVEWGGEGLGSYTGADNPASITVNGPITQTANFEESPLVANYDGQVVQTIPPENRALRVSFEGGMAGVTGRVYHRLGGQSGFTSAQMLILSPGTLEYVMPGTNLGVRGLEYYFEVDDGDNLIRLPDVDSVYIFRTQLTDVSIVTTTDQKFQMIGFPFEPSPTSVSSVFDEVTDKSNEGWRFGRWNPVTNVYDQYPALGVVARKNGYWLITKGGLAIAASGTSSVPDELQGATRGTVIRLQQGWNQVSNPFAFDVAVSQIDFDAGIEHDLHEFIPASGSYRTVATIQPFRGYWVYNGGANNAAMGIPYLQAGAVAVSDDWGNGSLGEWTVALTAQSGDRWDVDNRIGVRRGASAKYDAFDCSEPPVIGTYVSMAFDIPDANGASRSLTHDYRAAADQMLSYDVILRSNTGEPVTISADLASLPTNLRAVLIDPSNSERFELTSTAKVALPSVGENNSAHYELLIGTDEQLAAESGTSVTVPRAFSLSQNFPNPFNAGTVITYTLSTDADVELSIYDVLGRRVVTLVSGEAAAGIHHVQWDGHDAQGKDVASGMYFYRLRAGEHTDVRKMMLLK